MAALFCILFSHVLQVFVPETGFDAVWYHLPVIDTIAQQGFTTQTSLYQLLYPLWSDILFLPGYVLAGELGTKLIAFAGVLTLLLVTYVLSRQFLFLRHSIVTTMLVSTFQVVTWQAASFYIDVFMAMFTLAAFWYLLSNSLQGSFRRWSVLSILVTSSTWLGFAIGSKHFNFILLLPFAYTVWLYMRARRYVAFSSLLAIAVASPWYIHAYLQTGQILYPAFAHLADLTRTAEQSTLQFLFKRLVQLPLSLMKVAITRDYLSPILIFLLPAVYSLRKKAQSKHLVLLSVVAVEWAIWWFIPPFSTRYALAGFIGATILIVEWGSQLKNKKIFFITCCVLCAVMMMPRVWVNIRSLQYLLGFQTKEQYVRQFFDGSIDAKLQNWHGLP